MERLRIGIVKEEDISPVFIDFDNTDAGLQALQTMLNDTQDMGVMDLTSIGLKDVVMLFDNNMESSSGYNMAMQVFPMFGTLAFAQTKLTDDEDGIATMIDMDESTKLAITEKIKNQKIIEIDTGAREDIIKRINKVGKTAYLKEISKTLDQNYLEEAYQKAKREQEQNNG